MYGGITQGLFDVVQVDVLPDLIRYQVALNDALVAGLTQGASVAIDGVCQSVTAIEGHRVSFDAMAETLRCTTLNSLVVGRQVSVERSLRMGDAIGGHEMAGHVVGMVTVAARHETPNGLSLVCHCPRPWLDCLFQKGFVGLDGSSLTVGKVDRTAKTFTLHLIPETLRLTRFGEKQVGDPMNLELDFKTQVIVETVTRLLQEKEDFPL